MTSNILIFCESNNSHTSFLQHCFILLYICIEMRNWLKSSDSVGILASVVCLLHCLMLPVLILFRVPMSHWLEEYWHAFDFVFLGIGFVAVLYSARRTPFTWMRYFLWFSFAALAASITLKHYETVFNTIAIVAALVLIIAHIINLRQLTCAVKH